MGDAIAAFGLPSSNYEVTGDHAAWLNFFDGAGVQVDVDWNASPNLPSLVIRSVSVGDGFCGTVWGGLRIGMSARPARRFIRSRYNVVNQYERSIYFHPDDDVRFVANARYEFVSEIIGISLLFYPDGRIDG
ncbi:hypothetical protein [Neorhodopirellula lusitana]|uniref:hypothetical protein n=1 Tax=Neorhodopirellula lusitana TaxID=445327 RepID=UPI00384F8687